MYEVDVRADKMITKYRGERWSVGAWQFERIFELEKEDSIEQLSDHTFAESKRLRKIRLPRGMARHLILIIDRHGLTHSVPCEKLMRWACLIQIAEKGSDGSWRKRPAIQNETLIFAADFARLNAMSGVAAQP